MYIRGRHYTEDQIQEMMERKNNYYHEPIKNMSPKDLVPGGRELVQEIRDAGIKTATGSVDQEQVNTLLWLHTRLVTAMFNWHK